MRGGRRALATRRGRIAWLTLVPLATAGLVAIGLIAAPTGGATAGRASTTPPPTFSFGEPQFDAAQVREGATVTVGMPVTVSDGSVFTGTPDLVTGSRIGGKTVPHTTRIENGTIEVSVAIPTGTAGETLVVEAGMHQPASPDSISFSAELQIRTADGKIVAPKPIPPPGKPLTCIRVTADSPVAAGLLVSTDNFYNTFVRNVCAAPIAREVVDEWFPKQKVTLAVPRHPHKDSPHLVGFSLHGSHVRWIWTNVPGRGGPRLVQDLNVETHLLAGASGTVCNRVTVTIGAGTGAQTGDYSSALRGQNACPQIMRF